MAFNVNEFRSNISTKNDLAKRYNWQITAGVPFPLQCDVAEIPGRSFYTAEGKTYGPTYKVPYQSQYEPMNLSIICTNKFDERQYFENWAKLITTDDFNFNYQNTYTKQVELLQYDDAGTVVCTIKLIDAWPTTIAPMELNWADNSYHKLNIQLTYYRYILS